MKLAKSILCGVAALGMTAGAAVAQEEDYSSSSASNSESYYVLVEPMTVYEETYVIAEPLSDGQVAWTESPSPDVLVIIDGSDTLAQAPSDAEIDYSSVD